MLRNLWLRLLNPSSTFSVRPQSSQNSSNLNPQQPPPPSPPRPPQASVWQPVPSRELSVLKPVLWKNWKVSSGATGGNGWREETPFPDISSLQFNSPEQQSRQRVVLLSADLWNQCPSSEVTWFIIPRLQPAVSNVGFKPHRADLSYGFFISSWVMTEVSRLVPAALQTPPHTSDLTVQQPCIDSQSCVSTQGQLLYRSC